MDERDRGRYDRSRYQVNSGARESARKSSRASSEAPSQRGRYRDNFYDDMRIQDEPSHSRESYRSRINGEPSTRRSYSRAAVEQDLANGTARASRSRVVSPKRRANKKVLRVVLIAVVAAVLVGAGAAFAYITNVSNNLHSGVDDELRNTLVKTDMANEPFYMLLLGTDASAQRESDGEFEGSYRSDSIILARVDAPNKHLSMITIPRDTLVDIPGYGQDKINAAYAYGGAALAVKTVSNFAGVPISHYASIDFDGFQAMVDALGGVDVNVPMYIDDADAGGVLQAGEQTLTGEQALILARARNAYEGLASGDLMRAANQRMILSAIAKKVLAADVGTIANTVQKASEYVSTDLGLNDIIGLAQAMRGLNPDTDVYTATAPTTSQYMNDIWYEFVDKEAWAEMMKRMDAGKPPSSETTVDPNTGVVLSTAGDGAAASTNKYCTVTVANTTSTSGLAASLRTKLMDAGYNNVTIGDARAEYGNPNPETLVVYTDANRQNEAQAIVDAMGQGKAYYDQWQYYGTAGNDFLVIIGSDWKS